MIIIDIETAKKFLLRFQKSQKEQKKLKNTLNRTFALAKLLGNPQDKMKIIHTAGTSGKGSTCTIISHILVSHGFKIGMSLSPHIYDIRERCLINNLWLSESKFCNYLNQITPAIEEIAQSSHGAPSYFEIMIVLAYFIFFKEKVDYAVMETGAGGRLDATNIAWAKNKIAVITRIGKDHTDLLGNTLSKIAKEKTAIIHNANTVFTIPQNPKVQIIISNQAKKMGSEIYKLTSESNYANISSFTDHINFDFKFLTYSICNIYLALRGEYQAENCGLALSVVYYLAERDGFNLNSDKIRKTLKQIQIPARFDEKLFQGKIIIIDGAHNEQKLSAFTKSLKKIYPNEKFAFLIAFKKGKNYKSMLKYIVPIARNITVTGFATGKQTETFGPVELENIAKVIMQKYHFENVRFEKDLAKAIEISVDNTQKTLVVTGSIYLASDFYQYFKSMT